MNFIQRKLDLKDALAKKSVILFGPRQSGKSFLVKNMDDSIFALKINLLDGKTKFHALQNPGYLKEIVELKNLSDCVIFIDEIQMCAQMLDEIHLLIEERNIRFLMTGSSARKLRQRGTNLLGGRAWTKFLFPLTYSEVGGDAHYNLPHIFKHGLLPPMFLSSELDIEENLSAYVGTYLTEEIATEATSRSLSNFSRFLKIAALTNGQIVNFTNIASDSQVPVQTVRQWYQILIDTLLGFFIEPYQGIKKRKSINASKFYFFDIAIARTLKEIGAPSESNAEFGEFFEQLVCMELRAWIGYTRPRSKLTYWRTYSGLEVDFCVDDELAIEVKSTENVQEKHLKGLKTLREEGIFKRYIVICQETISRKHDSIEIWNWKDFFSSLWNSK